MTFLKILESLSGLSVGVHFDVNLTAIAATSAGIERSRFEGHIA